MVDFVLTRCSGELRADVSVEVCVSTGFLLTALRSSRGVVCVYWLSLIGVVGEVKNVWVPFFVEKKKRMSRNRK